MKIIAKVVPNSSKDEVIANPDNTFTIKVTDAPEKNKANYKVLKLLKKYFGKQTFLVRGGKSREKEFKVVDC